MNVSLKNNYVQLLLVLFLLVSTAFIGLEKAEANNDSSSKHTTSIVATIKTDNPITETANPQNTKFTVNHVINVTQSIPQTAMYVRHRLGNIQFPIQSSEDVSNVEGYTTGISSGVFTPIIYNDTIFNPELIEEVTPGSDYTVTFSYNTHSDIMYDNETATCYYMHSFKPNMPTTYTINLPSDYFVSFHNAVKETETENYNIFTWEVSNGTKCDVVLNFLPFQNVEIKLESICGFNTINSLFPTVSAHEFTTSICFTSTAQYADWVIPPLDYFIVPFPFYGSKIEVIKIASNSSNYTLSVNPIEKGKNNTPGTYYVDSQNNQVIICPFSERKGNFYQYDITSTFNYELQDNSLIKSNLPYSHQYLIFLSKDVSDYWNVAATNFTISCLLPANVDAQAHRNELNEPYRPKINVLENRQLASFVGLPLEDTEIIFTVDIVPLKNFYQDLIFYDIVFGIGLIAIGVISYYFAKSTLKKAIEASIAALISIRFVVANFNQYYSLSSDFNPSYQYITLLIIQALLWVGFILTPFIIGRFKEKKERMIV